MSAETKVYEDKMDGVIRHLTKELAAIRAGRANPAVLDKVTVDYYGTATPINQVAAIAVSEARIPVSYTHLRMAQLMQQAQQMQENVKKKQEELEQTSYSVTAGGGMVELTMTGNHQVTSLKLNPDVVQPDDIEMLEDLVAAAVNEAVRVVDEAADKEMAALTGGLNIPGL